MILKGKPKQDRRRGQRQILNTSVQVFTESGHVDALGINLSDGGMCLFAIANLPLESQIQIEFLPPRCLERVRVCGIVRHRAVYLYGVEFLVGSDHRQDRPTLSGHVSKDWGVCGNPASPRAGLLMFEHQGCTEFEPE